MFPKPGIDLVQHELRVDLFGDRDGKEERLETLVFEGRMLLERGGASRDKEGTRRIDFRVRRWEATAWSDTLDAVVTYATGDNEQPLSYIVSEGAESDYPATLTFNVVFDAYLDGELVFRAHEGRPEGHGFLEIPPSGYRKSSPTITSFEDTLIEAKHPKLGVLRFKPRDCNDQNSVTLKSFPDDRERAI